MKKIVLVFLLVLLSSCSFKSLIIPNLAFLIADRIDSRFHLYNEQEYQVRREINQLLKDEKTRIKSIQKYFNNLELKNIDEKKGYAFFASNYKAIALKVNRILAAQLASLDKKQIEKFKNSMLKENKEIEERANEKKPKDFYKRYAYFFGDLTEEQKKLILKNMKVFRDLAKKRIAERLNTQSSLYTALNLNNKRKKEELIVALFDGNADRSELTPERLRSMVQFKTFMSTITSEQEIYFSKKKKFFNEWLDAYLSHY